MKVLVVMLLWFLVSMLLMIAVLPLVSILGALQLRADLKAGRIRADLLANPGRLWWQVVVWDALAAGLMSGLLLGLFPVWLMLAVFDVYPLAAVNHWLTAKLAPASAHDSVGV